MLAQAYNIVLVRPQGFPHLGVFTEVARLLEASIRTLGHRCDVRINEFRGDALNIVLNYHVLAGPEALPPVRYVIYQLEQLRAEDPRVRSQWLPLLARAPAVWDYSQSNLAFLAAEGIRVARHVPFGFHPALRSIAPARGEDIDVLFYGSVNPRRRVVLDELERRGLLHRVFGVYGPVRDALIARAKVVLNVGVADASPFEQVRVSYLLNNGKCVIAEDAPGNPYQGMVVTAAYRDLPDVCAHYVRSDEDRRRVAGDGARQFAGMPMAEVLREALAGLAV